MSKTDDKESSLTTPSDRLSTRENPWMPSFSEPPLNKEDSELAMEDLNLKIPLSYPKIERIYTDPALMNQNIGLVSFVPSKGATPDKNGIFGFAKLRGNFGTEMEANQRAFDLIKNYDSYHKIFHAYVGKPFPITVSSKYSEDVSEIDLAKEIKETYSSDIKAKKAEEQREIKEIKEKENRLLENSKKASKNEPTDEDEPFEKYITLKVKKAQLTWTYGEHTKKMVEVKDILVNTMRELDELDEIHSDFKDKYFEKYKAARETAGLPDDGNLQDNFVKYMVDDFVFPEIQEAFDKKYKQ